MSYHDRLVELAADETEHWKLSGWSSKDSQRQRFARLTIAARYAGGSVLDWGCGAGDLVEFLNGLGHAHEYRGVDVNTKLIDRAREKHGDLFSVVDLDYQPTTTYDYVFASGLFQFADAQDPDYYVSVLRTMYSVARKAVAVNFLSANRDPTQMTPDELYLKPEALIAQASSMTTRWTIDHSYHPGAGDFTLALIRPGEEKPWTRPSFTRLQA